MFLYKPKKNLPWRVTSKVFGARTGIPCTKNSAQQLLGSSRRQLLQLGGICRQLALIEICQQMYTLLKVYRQSYCIQLSKILPNANI